MRTLGGTQRNAAKWDEHTLWKTRHTASMRDFCIARGALQRACTRARNFSCITLDALERCGSREPSKWCCAAVLSEANGTKTSYAGPTMRRRRRPGSGGVIAQRPR